MTFMNRFLSLLLLLACSFVAQAASPAYNTSTGVVSPTQFLKLDAAELKVMGNPVSTNSVNLYNSNGTLSDDRTVDGDGNDLIFDNIFEFAFGSDVTESAGTYTSIHATEDMGIFAIVNIKVAHATAFTEIYQLAEADNAEIGLFATLGAKESTVDIGYGPGITVIKNTDELRIQTPAVIATSAVAGNVLVLTNAATGESEWMPISSAIMPTDQTANNLTITNALTVKGSIKADNLTITNNVSFYNNTYVSNIYSTSTTVSNDITVIGNYIGTIDPTVTGTVLKLQKSLKLQFPRKIDGAGCTYSNTNDYTSLLFMLPTFSPTAATNVNNCDFAFRVPGDLDTSKDLTASLTIRLTDVDTGAHTYNVGMISIANSASASGTPANYVPLTISGDGSGASGDIESVSAVTLTDWRSNMTAGQWCLVRLNRDGDDASTIASNLMELEIFYWATQ